MTKEFSGIWTYDGGYEESLLNIYLSCQARKAKIKKFSFTLLTG